MRPVVLLNICDRECLMKRGNKSFQYVNIIMGMRSQLFEINDASIINWSRKNTSGVLVYIESGT